MPLPSNVIAFFSTTEKSGKCIHLVYVVFVNSFLMWKSSVINASDHIFPGLVYYDRENEYYSIANRIQSNLPLQIALYINVRFFPVWLIVVFLSLDAKYYTLSEVYKFLAVTTFILISILECIRLYLGYLGNLAEKIPELASFWLISTLIQLPLEIFILFNSNMLPHTGEVIVNIVMLLLLSLEIITGMVALKNSADHHAKQFYISQIYKNGDNISIN